MDGQEDYAGQFFGEMNVKFRDLEEKQNLLKDRLLLIGQNLIEVKEKSNDRNLEIKKEIEEIREAIDKMKSFLQIVSSEFSKFARKDDVEILAKQAKMFQPLEFIKKSDLKK